MSEPVFDNSRLERVKNELEGSPAGTLDRPLGGTLTPHDISVQSDWNAPPKAPGAPRRKYVEVSIFKFFIGIVVLMFVASIGVLIYKVLEDPDAMPSDKNVAVRIDGPVSVSAGEPTDFSIVVSNKNRVALAYATLVVTYPDGTRSPADLTKPLREEKKILGEVMAGGEATFSTKAVFLGEERTEKSVHVSLEYRIAGVNSSLVKDQEYLVTLSASPINVTVDTLREVSVGQEFQLKVDLAANTRETLENVLVKVDYPFGFTYKDASEKPAFQNNVWRIDRVDPGSKQSITIRGTLTGEDGQGKVFRAYTGTQGRQEYEIETSYGSVLSEITIKKPFLALGITVNGDDSEPHVAQFTDAFITGVTWRNNLATRVTNASIEIRLNGTILDRKSIIVQDGGYYDSKEDTIRWDERQTPELAQIDAGKSGTVGFRFTALPPQTKEKLFRNPEVLLSVSVKGKRTSEAGVPEEINTIVTRSIHLTTDVRFASRAVHFDGPIQNSGPIPPRVGQETTYTIIWSIVNPSNNLDGTMVMARLPTFVKWENAVEPQAEDIAYDPNRGMVTWNAGQVTAGAGIISPAKQVAFQVSIDPSTSQIGKEPALLLESTLQATDDFTNAAVERKVAEVNTSAPTDPGVPKGGGKVLP